MKPTPTRLLAVMMAVLLTSVSHAALLVYEPFNYPVGTLTGQNAGKGFAGAWVTPAAVANQAGIVYDQSTTNVGTESPALTWDGKVNNLPTLPVVGARYQGANTTNSNLTISRSLATSAGTIAATNGGVVWLSAACHFANQGYGAGITIGLANGTGYVTDRGRAFSPTTMNFLGVNGYNNAGATWNYRLNTLVTSNGWTAGAYTETLGPTALSSTLDLVVVLKYTFNNGTNTVEGSAFTENDTLSEANFYSHASHISATLVGGIDPTTLTNLAITQGRIANALDEIRIGTSFTDVISLPPAGPVNATNSTVVAAPTTVLADGTATSTVTVTLLDSLGIPVTNKNVTLANTAGPKAATITPSGAQPTGTNGQATFTVKSGTAGTEVFTATNTTDSQVISQTTSVLFAPLTGDASVSTVVASPTNVVADGLATSTITVTIKSSGGFPMANKSVTLGASPGPVTISPVGAQVTGTNGQVTFTASTTTAGTMVFTATNTTDVQVINQTASVVFASAVGDASLSAVTASPTNVIANGATTSTITVTVKNFGGLPLANKSVTLGGSPGIATISPAGAQTTGTNGQVTFTASSTAPGTVVFTATNTTDGQVISQTASVQFYDYSSWAYSAAFYVLTTTNGANLPASAMETNFPILLRLNSGNFNFSQAKTNGADIRFTTAATNALPYEIEQWDAVNGTASIWVQVPSIKGNTNQQLLMFWGNPTAPSQSSGASVFNLTNGYACVLHMNGVTDSVGALAPANVGTTATNGVAGPARHFNPGQGINCGTSLTNLPSGGTNHTTEAWFRASASGNTLVAWGYAAGASKVVMQLASPPHINVDCWFSAGNVASVSPLNLSQWYHVAHVYSNLQARVYVNGVLDGSASGSTAMNIPSPAALYVGGWSQVSGTYDFSGEMDEVRLSKMARSSNWLRLEYQNQSPVQSLVGHLVQPGNTFSVSATSVTLNEGGTTNLTAQAGGAIKVYWLLKQSGQTNVIAADQFSIALATGRITGNQSFAVQFKAVYADGSIQTTDIPVTVLDTIPDPMFTLVASTNLWDGRSLLTVTPVISNWAALVAAGATNLNFKWTVSGVAATAQTPSAFNAPGVYTTTNLVLVRSQGSGPLTATLALDNGGAPASSSASVTVQEPATDAWVVRTPDATEKPVNNQFFARDNTGYGTIYYNGTIGGSPDSVFLNVYSNGVLYTNISVASAGGAYALSARILGGLITYSVQFGSVTGGVTNVLDTVTNLVCGDAFIIEGQSNAQSVAPGQEPATNVYTSNWIRSYGTMASSTTNGAIAGGWGLATRANSEPRIGYWGMDLATNLLATYNMPICIINGAVGGTIISQHQPIATNRYTPLVYNPASAAAAYGIYANLLWRVAAAKLTHGIKAVFWHQGESDQAAGDPTGNYDYVAYQSYFVNLAGAWKQDFPNIQRYYLFQIYPNACSIGGGYYSDMVREVQRTLPNLFSSMSIMSTLIPEGGNNCHFTPLGYAQLADSIAPLVKQYTYGTVPATVITAPNVTNAWFTTTNRNEIALAFNQDMKWNPAAPASFYLDRIAGQVISGSASGNVIKLQLYSASTNQTIGYVVDQFWGNNTNTLIYGSNGIAALTFYAVPIAPPPVVASPAPILNSLAPVTGRTNGGTVVTLTGANFLSGASVQFGGNPAASVNVDSATQITASTPAHAAGSVNVVVVNTNGLAVTNLNAFTYVLPPMPASLGSVGLSQNNLVMVWSGAAGQPCVLLSATNLTQPRSSWTPVETNTIAPSGLVTNTVPVGIGDPQRFYLLSIPYN